MKTKPMTQKSHISTPILKATKNITMELSQRGKTQ